MFFKTQASSIVDLTYVRKVYIEEPKKGFFGNGNAYAIVCLSVNNTALNRLPF